MDIGTVSIKGKVRERDEDAILVILNESLYEGKSREVCFCALADGMGGLHGGDVASRIAIRTMESIGNKLISQNITDTDMIFSEISDGFERANRNIVEFSREKGIESMGTTMIVAYYTDGFYYVGNLGDSRAFLFNNRKVSTRTVDHSLVQTMVLSGELSEEEMSTHPRRNELTRALGIGFNKPDLYKWRAFNGDALLLCCDGLWESLDRETLALSANSKMSAQETILQLSELANEFDGSDNISAILFRPRIRRSMEKYSKKPTRRITSQ